MDVQLEDTLELLESLSPLRSVQPRAPGLQRLGALLQKYLRYHRFFTGHYLSGKSDRSWCQAQLSLNSGIYV